jgi:predicted PhzF superfamily epimerase YddE/YHI9
MAELHVLRVFVGGDGQGGNPLGVFLEGHEVPSERRQPIATELGFSETVFVEDAGSGEMRIFTPAEELPFAGHPSVGTAWLLARERSPVEALHPPAGEVQVRYEPELTWIAGRPEWAPPMDYVQLSEPDAVDALAGPPDDLGAVYCWAWIDEEGGKVRSRAFFHDLGIEEDEATGAAAIALSGRLGRALEIRQGQGSELLARPLADGLVEVGGRCELDGVRQLG